MEIKLDKKINFVIEYEKKGKFTFKNDSRSIYILATQGFTRTALCERAKADLISIEGFKSKDGDDVTAKDFEAIPFHIYAHVLSEYEKMIVKKVHEIAPKKKS